MDNQVEVLKQELGKLARKIHTTYENITYEEVGMMQKVLDRLQVEIEGVFKQSLGVVPRNVISNLMEQTKTLLKKEIEASRVAERNENVTNRLGGVAKASSLQGISRGIQEYTDSGVYVNKTFEEKLDEVLSRVIKAYRTVLEQYPSRRADMALDDIRGICRGKFNRIQEHHKDCSKEIKSKVLRQLEEMGVVLSNAERQQVEQKVDKETLSFGEQLAANVEEPIDVTKKDVKELSENEKAFKDSPARDEEKVQNNIAMFK